MTYYYSSDTLAFCHSALWLTLLLEIPNELFPHCVAVLQHGFELREAASRTVLCQILHGINIITFSVACLTKTASGRNSCSILA